MQEQKISRRNVVKALGVGTVGAATVGGATFLSTGKARAQADIEAEDLGVTTPKGEVGEIRIYANAHCEYQNVDPEVTGVGLHFSVNGEPIYDVVDGRDSAHIETHGDGDLGPNHGRFEYYGNQGGLNKYLKLFEQTSFGPEDFEVPEDGTSETFDMDFAFEFTLLNDDQVILTSNTAEATAQLTIHNEEDSSDGGDGDNGSGGSDPEAAMSGVQVSLTVELPNGEEVSS